MNVTSVMEANVCKCSPDTNLETAAMMMWNNDCGSLPVVDDTGIPIGIITDRDIVMSSALNHKPLWDLTTKEVTNNRPLYTCNMGDDVNSALEMMQIHHIRRLPVIDDAGHLEGILSIDNIVARSEKERTPDLSYENTINTLKAVYKHH